MSEETPNGELPTWEMRKSPERKDVQEVEKGIDELEIQKTGDEPVVPSSDKPQTDGRMSMENEGPMDGENVNPNVSPVRRSPEKSRKIKVLDTNKKVGEFGKRVPEMSAGGAP